MTEWKYYSESEWTEHKWIKQSVIDWSIEYEWIIVSKLLSEWLNECKSELSEHKWIESERMCEWISKRIRLNLWACPFAVVFRGGAFLTVIGRMCWPTNLWRWAPCSRLGSREVRAADIWVWTFPSVPMRRTPSVTTGTNTSPLQVTHWSLPHLYMHLFFAYFVLKYIFSAYFR